MRDIKQKTKNRTKGKTAIKRNTKKRTTIKRNKRNTKKRGLKKRGGSKRSRDYEDDDDDEDNKLQRVEDEDEINVDDELQKKINAIGIESLNEPHGYPVETADDIIEILKQNDEADAQIFEHDDEGEAEFKDLLHKKLLQKLLEMYNNPPRWTSNQVLHERNLTEYDKEMLEIVELLKKYDYTLDNKLITGIIPSLLY